MDYSADSHPPIELACSYSSHLVELIQAGEVSVDRIEVGPWFPPDQIRAFQARLPGHKFHIHDSNLHQMVGLMPDTLRRIAGYHDVTDSLFASLHISLLLPGLYRLLNRGIPVPRLGTKQASRMLVWQAKQVRDYLHKPVILENMPGMPRHLDEGRPEHIRAILEAADCDMLLDIGHARIAASLLHMEFDEYLNALPLERVRQIHVHRPGKKERLVDAHEPLQEEDYALIQWLLQRTRPRIITLEYWRKRERIHEQLGRLRTIIDG